MRGSFKLGKIAGIQIGVHYTWLFALVLFTWLFASGFSSLYTEWRTPVYWVMGIIVSLGLFVSVLLHELCHSLVANKKGLKVDSIVFFIFGGVSNIEKEPESAGSEFIIAIAGPACSVVLGGILFLIATLVVNPETPTPLAVVLTYLAFTNWVLAVFNIIPGFPLDGGRVLRSIIWAVTKNLHRATLIAGNVGRVFGWLLILFGVTQILGWQFWILEPSIFNGIWMILIGWFLSSAADNAMREQSMKENLSGMKVKDVMDRNPECVMPGVSVESVVKDSFMQRGLRSLPVCIGSELMGIVTLMDIRKVPQEEWNNTPVQQIMTRSPLKSVNADDDLVEALRSLSSNDYNQIPVMAEGKFVGLLSRADVVRYLQTRKELGIDKRPL